MSSGFKLASGQYFISTEAAGGLYSATQLRKIADICDQDDTIVKATEDQRLALFVSEEKLESTVQILKSIGLTTRHYQTGVHQPVSCVGELCQFANQDALGLAMEMSGESFANSSAKNPLKIGINGCPRMCVPTQTLDISITGDEQGYRIALGGKSAAIGEIAAFAAENIPADEIPAIVQKIIALFREQATDGETLHDVMERVGAAPFMACLGTYAQDSMMNLSSQYQGPGGSLFDDVQINQNSQLDEQPSIEEIPIHEVLRFKEMKTDREESSSEILEEPIESLEDLESIINLDLEAQLEAELESAIAEQAIISRPDDDRMSDERDNLLVMSEMPSLSLGEEDPIQDQDENTMEILPMDSLDTSDDTDISVSKVFIDTTKQQLVVRFSDLSEFKVALTALKTKAKKFHFQESEIHLKPDDDRICVEVDGLEFNLATTKKAA